MIIAPLAFLAAGRPAPVQGLAWAIVLLGLGTALMAALGVGSRDRALPAPVAALGLAFAVGGVARTPLIAPGPVADAVSVGAGVAGLLAAVVLFRRTSRRA